MSEQLKMITRIGFTLIELLLVIGIIAVLASIVIVAVNPQEQLQSARNARRNSDSTAIQSAINQYYLDNEGLPGDKTWTSTKGTALDICAPSVTDASCVNIEDDLVPLYIAAVPVDPDETDPLLSGYAGYQTSSPSAFLISGLRIVIFSRHATGTASSSYSSSSS